MIIDCEKIIQDRISEAFGLENYGKIMKMVLNVDVSSDKEFQKLFNRFYRVRRNETWRTNYYTLFEMCKKEKTSFESIVFKLYKLTGNVEASFASKMLSTIDSSKPIWDHFVIEALGIQVPNQLGDVEKRIQKISEIYNEIDEWYKEFLETDEAKNAIKKFDSLMPIYAWISPVKKIDFFLWSVR